MGSCILNPPIGIAATGVVVASGTSLAVGFLASEAEQFVNLGTPSTTTNNLACASVAARDLGKSAIAKLSK